MHTETVIDKTIAGFPVVIVNPTYRKIQGEKVLAVKHNEIFRKIFLALIFKPGPLSGNEVRFIRRYLDMTQSEFAREFTGKDDVGNHARISAWEKKKDQPTDMEPAIEAAIRMNMATKFKDIDKKSYREELERRIAGGMLKKKSDVWTLVFRLPTMESQMVEVSAA